MARTFLHPFTRPQEEQFLTITRGRGALVWDERGRELVDGMASLWYCQVGHGREEIVAAVAEQMRRIEAYHTFAPFTNEPAERLAEELVARSPLPDGRVFFTSSGSEAVDTAIKLTRLFHRLRSAPERQLIVALTRAYHGVTYGGTSAQGIDANREGWGRLVPDIVHVPAHDLDAATELFASRGREVAAVLVEPVQGAGGIFPPPDGYLEGLRRLCDRYGALLIADEVITGFGRLGAWFGCERLGLRPDLVVFAKGVTSGYLPLGGVVVSPGVCASWDGDDELILRHGFTYSGHPTACAAARANLEVMANEDLPPRAERIAERLGGPLRDLARAGRAVEVRGMGGMWGVVLPVELPAAQIRDALIEEGVIARPLPGNVLAWCPPLVITDEQIDRCVEALDRVLPR